ncbi:MAG: MFS transporter [Planctomycetaceae bacterium]|nr:MFS transporter [Planctomycetaceae bacterium]
MSNAAPAAPTAASSVNKSTLFLVFATVFIDLLGFGIVLPLLPRYGALFNAGGWQLGLLMASFSAMQFLFAPMWGRLSDRVGRRPVLLLGLAGSTVSYGLFGLVSAQGRDALILGFSPLTWLYLTRIGAGISGATISTAQAVIADCTGVENRGKGMALIGAAFGIGFTFGPLIGAVCVTDDAAVALNDVQWAAVKSWDDDTTAVSEPQFRETVFADTKISRANDAAISALLATPLARNELKQRLLRPPSGMPGYVASMLSAMAFLLATFKLQESRRPSQTTAGSSHRAFRPGEVWRHLSTPGLSVILLAVFITTFGFAQFESTLSLLTDRFGYSAQWNFLLYAYVGLVLTIGQGLLVRRFLPRTGERRMALIGVTLMTIGFSLIGAMGLDYLPGSALWFILPIVVVGFSAVTPSLQSMLSQAASSDEQGSVLGTGQSLSSLARILGPLFGVKLLYQSASLPYFLGAILILIGGALVRRMPGRQQTAG